MRKERIIFGFLGLLVFISYFFHYQKQIVLKQNGGMTTELAEILYKPKLMHLDTRTQNSKCVINGPYPDHNCTPGAIFSDVTTEQICTDGYSKSVRSVSKNLREQVYAEYGISYPEPKGTFEADHFIPLELGGSNDIANLFPEAVTPYPGFKEKDIVENFLHIEVCSGHIALSVAQEQIVSDWVAVYNALTPEQIENLKSKYATWAK